MTARTHSALANSSRSHQREREGHQRIELPHNCHGDVDWATLGNILTANLLGEVIKASYADYKHGRMTRSFEADTDWKFAYEEHDVLVLRKKVKDSPIHCFMGRGFINRPVEEVAQFVGNIQARRKWDKYLVEIREVERLSDTDFLLYMYHEATQCLVKSRRDFLCYMRMKFVDGKYIQTAMSVEHPILPPQPGIIRAQIRPGSGWVLEPYKGNPSKTLVSYVGHLDLVSLPAIITNRVMRRQPMSIHYIREFLTPPDLFPSITEASNDQHIPSNNGFTPTCDDQDGGPYEEEPASNGCQYEEPISIVAFTGKKTFDHHSVPIEVDHHWKKDSYPARPRLISEGSGDRNASSAATNTCKDSTSVQRKGQNMAVNCVGTAQGEEEAESQPQFEATTTRTTTPSHMNGTHATWDTHVQELWKVLPMASASSRVFHQGTNGDLKSGDFDVRTKPSLDMAHPPVELLRSGRDGDRPLKASFVTPGSSVGSLSDLERAGTTPPSVSDDLSGLPPPVTRYRNTRNQAILHTHHISNSNPLTDSSMVTTIASSHSSRSLSESDSFLEGTMESQVGTFGTASSGSSCQSFHSASPYASEVVLPSIAFGDSEFCADPASGH